MRRVTHLNADINIGEAVDALQLHHNVRQS
jgi:hypothetical protein